MFDSEFDLIMRNTAVPALMEVFGVPAIYRRSADLVQTDITAAFELNDAREGTYGEITEPHPVAMLNRQEIEEPVRGDQIICDDKTFTVDGILFTRSDAYTVTVALKESES
jgi:hypothetical protein